MKYALIIGNNKYDDPKLAQLKTPAADSQALAKVLADKNIGSFDEVSPLIDRTETEIRRAISSFLSNKKPDDLVLVYFSGHGVLDDRGRLFLSLKDTETTLLKATAIPSTFISDEMDSCRSKRQILILDCCHSGAFARGTKGEQKAVTEATFEGSGYGRVVMTASDSTQYALEGDQVISQTKLSLFTHFLLEGLKTGEADIDNDGHISLDEWYDYTYARVISETPKQIPHRWSYNQQGDLIIARNPNVKKRVVELPHELTQALESSFGGIRESAVNELGKYLHSHDPEMVDLAVSALEKMKEDDSRRISLQAARLLSEFEQARVPAGKAITSAPPADLETEPANSLSGDPLASPETIPEIRSTSRPVVGSAPVSQELVSNSSSLSNWIGTSVAALVFSFVSFYYYNLHDGGSTPISVIVFALVAGVSSLIQWFVFRNQLKIWWVLANTGAGIVLGGINYYLFNNTSWGLEYLGILLAVWIIGNFALGRSLVGETQEGPNEFSSTLSSRTGTPLTETGTRPNIFIILLALSLVFSVIYTFAFVLDLGVLINPVIILYGIAAILAGLSFALKKDMPRSFGFIALAVFLFVHGITAILYVFMPDSPLFVLYPYMAVIPLACAIYFIFQKWVLKNFGFLMLSGYLISTGLCYFFIEDLLIYKPFLVISAIFALPAAVLLFLRK